MPRKKTLEIETPTFKSPESVISEIRWLSKKKRGYSKFEENVKDIRIALGKTYSKKTKTTIENINVTFRNHMEKAICKNNPYIIFGVVKNRIYFKEAEPVTGYKVGTKHLTAITRIQINEEEKALYEPFNNQEYPLKYDDFQELYYIEREADND